MVARPLRFALLLVALLPAASAALTAGDVDDHLNWDRYLAYLERAGANQDLPALHVADRATILVLDGVDHPVAFANVTIHDSGQGLVHRTAGSDGLVRLFPQRDGLSGALTITAAAPGGAVGAAVSLAADATGAARSVIAHAGPSSPGASLDLLFLIDTTGSMSDELAYVTSEVDAIVSQAVASHSNADVRLGLILYRDTGDDYVVRNLGFTGSVSTMHSWLAAQKADGGGDMPEAMDQALSAAVAAQWRGGATSRVLFLVADAPPHEERYSAFLAAVGQAQAKGIHIYPVGASGVESHAEYLMRAAAVLTQGRYVFLTDDSGIGNSHAEPSIACYQVTELKGLLARIVDGEMAGHRIEAAAKDVVRTVGHPDHGACLADPDPQQQVSADPPESEVDGTAAGSAGGSSGAAAASGTGSMDRASEMAVGDSDGSAMVGAPAPGPGGDSSDAVPSVGEKGRAKAPGLEVPLLAVGLVLALALSRRRV